MNFPIARSDGSFVSPSHQNGPRRPGDPVSRQAPNQLRVMVAGESGLGKTTFLNNIFRHLTQGENPMDQASVVHEQTGGISGHSKTIKIAEREFDHTNSDGQCYKFFLVDTPGYGDHVNVRKSFQPVPIDIEYMKQPSKVVAVIPVVGKSDSMTVDEMINFKEDIAYFAAQANGLGFFNFSERAWRKCLGALNIADEPIWLGERRPPPYAVISSQVDDPNGTAHAPDPVRRYPWGDCHVMRPEHSDNTYLQCLLLEVVFQDMKDEMRKRYEAKPLVKKIGENMPEYRRTVAGGKLSILVVVLTAICALLAGNVANPQVYGSDGLILPINPNMPLFSGLLGVHSRCLDGVEPSMGEAGWSEVMLTIQRLEGSDRTLAAVDTGGEHLDVLMEVLMEDSKIWTETSEEVQDTPPGPEAATIEEEGGAAKGTDHPPFETEAATLSVGTQAPRYPTMFLCKRRSLWRTRRSRMVPNPLAIKKRLNPNRG
ncbi:Sept4ps, septin GTPase, pseudogene [Ectocarpus siliculosus]|nr:Sept4ps, septin GTPase, pseudogene [Ectocarpus siliculosus]|eukprot:CBJ31642.1 Sept4ps, septin GTPase, pseudogene [Ectocarpus siliculosus]